MGAFHDAVILYALALNETLAAGYNATDGAEITHRMWNKTFKGDNGPPPPSPIAHIKSSRKCRVSQNCVSEALSSSVFFL